MRKKDDLFHKWSVLLALSIVALSLYEAGFFPHTYDHGKFKTKLMFDFEMGGGSQAAVSCDDLTYCKSILKLRLPKADITVHEGTIMVKSDLPQSELLTLIGPGSLKASIDGKVMFRESDVTVIDKSLSVKKRGDAWVYTVALKLSDSAATLMKDATSKLDESESILSSPLLVELDNISISMNIPSNLKGQYFDEIVIGGYTPTYDSASSRANTIWTLLSYGTIKGTSRVSEIEGTFDWNGAIIVAVLLLISSAVILSKNRGKKYGLLSIAYSLGLLTFSAAALSLTGTIVDKVTAVSFVVPLTLGMHFTQLFMGGDSKKRVLRRAGAIAIVGIFLILTLDSGAGIVVFSTAVGILAFAPAVGDTIKEIKRKA